MLLFVRGESPSNTMWPGPRPTSVSSLVASRSIQIAVWPRYIPTFTRHDRQTGQRSRRRTVTSNDRPKTCYKPMHALFLPLSDH